MRQLAGEECCPEDSLEQADPSHLAKWSSLCVVEAWQASSDFYSLATISKDRYDTIRYDTIGTIAKDFCYIASNCYNKLLLKQCLYCSLLLYTLLFWLIVFNEIHDMILSTVLAPRLICCV